MGDIDVLESVLSTDEALIGGVTPEAAFGPRVDVPDPAPAVDRLRGFMGRTP